MADKDSIDVLMTFIDTSGNGVSAEGTTLWDKDDTDMMKDFEDGKFFEVDDFTFGVGLSDSEGSGGAEGGGSSSSRHTGDNVLHSRPGEEHKSETAKGGRKGGRSSSSKFAKYIETGQVGTMDFKAEVQEIIITRQIDISSIRFLQSCLTFKKFQKAVLVKRKFTGSYDFHEAFLRLEFKEPLISGIEWDEGDVVKEKLKFVCRGIIAAYRPQNADGTLGDARSAQWQSVRQLAGGSR
jgi:type VI protein secretion system component Hcp